MLGGAAATGAAAALLPLNVQKALAATPSRPGKFSDPSAIKLSTGRSVFYQPDPNNPDGYELPFHLDTNTSSAQSIPSTSHARSVQHEAWNNGLNNNWLPAHTAATGPTPRTSWATTTARTFPRRPDPG